MGLFDLFKKKEDQERYVDMRSNSEKRVAAGASKALREPLEGYAKEIVKLFQTYPGMYEREPKLRAIGEKMNDNDKQMRVAYRSQYLAAQAGLGDRFSTRYLEYAWEGLGGWMA